MGSLAQTELLAEDVWDALSLIASLAQITDLQQSANNSANFPN